MTPRRSVERRTSCPSLVLSFCALALVGCPGSMSLTGAEGPEASDGKSPLLLGGDLNTQGAAGATAHQIISAGTNDCGSGIDHVITTMSCVLEKTISPKASGYASDPPALLVRVPGGPVRWCYSLGAKGPWRDALSTSVTLSSLGLGDFDGDGKTDVIYSRSGVWYISSGGVTSWQERALQSIPVTEFLVGDFDGDGHDDLVFDGC